MSHETAPIVGERLWRVWWSYIWRAALGGFLLGCLMGALTTLFLKLIDLPEWRPYAILIMAFLAQTLASFLAFKAVMGKGHDGWSIRLLRDSDERMPSTSAT